LLLSERSKLYFLPLQPDYFSFGRPFFGWPYIILPSEKKASGQSNPSSTISVQLFGKLYHFVFFYLRFMSASLELKRNLSIAMSLPQPGSLDKDN
jgi:hypothetical protein